MTPRETPPIEAAEVVLPCAELDPTLDFFTGRLGFRLLAIAPADAPRTAVVAGPGLRIRLERDADGDPGRLRLTCADPDALGARTLMAPNGTRVEVVAAAPPLALPPLAPALVVTRASDDWGVGRAGMRYRDLVPDRQGGRVVASHVRIPAGGPVPDYVHFHEVRFQLIYCYRGWVRVVYEDQGPPFVLRPGDCVLQPPRIRHRVLECSPGLEVIEVGSPAEHETRVDHDLALPTATRAPERDFDGQRFVRHVAAEAAWTPGRLPGFEARDTGIGAATGGLGGVRVLRPAGPEPARAGDAVVHSGELQLGVVLAGALALDVEGRAGPPLGPGDAFCVPAGLPHALARPSPDLELLEVTLPAELPTRPTA